MQLKRNTRIGIYWAATLSAFALTAVCQYVQYTIPTIIWFISSLGLIILLADAHEYPQDRVWPQ